MAVLSILWRKMSFVARRPLAIFAIIERELRVAARRPAAHRIRVAAALGALGLIVWKVLTFSWERAPGSEMGRSLFMTLSVLAFIYCLFVGVRATSDCVSEEKREGTLGLLFLTDLKGIDVVLGKLMATSLNAFYGLLAIFPALAISLLFGGVTLAEYGKMTLVLLNTLFFSLSIGLLVSSLSRNERKAASATVLTVLAPTFFPLALVLVISIVVTGARDLLDFDVLFRWIFAGRDLNPVAYTLFTTVAQMELCNPVFSLICVLFDNRTLPGMPIWTSSRYLMMSLALVQVMSWLALLAASHVLPRVWKDRPSSRLVMNWRERWFRLSQGDSALRQRFRTALLNVNAYYWLMGRDRLKPPYAWFFLTAMVGIWSWRYLQDPNVMFDFNSIAPTVMIIHTFLKVWVIAECSHRLVEDQRSGALELLLSTPLGTQQIVQGQLLALKRQFAGPLIVLCIIELLAFGGRYSPAVILFVQTMLVADVLMLMWVSMWLSLSARSLNHVILLSIGLVLAAPFAAFVTTLSILEQFRTPTGFEGNESKWLSLALAALPLGSLWMTLRKGTLNHGRELLRCLALTLPWLIYAASFTITMQGWRWQGRRQPIPFELRVLLWFVIGMVFNALILGWAKSRLLHRFRSEVLRRFERTTEQPSPKSVPTLKSPVAFRRESLAHR